MKFSIIVPCYNLADYIGEALDSVLAQTYSDWECIVVDDGSTDASPQIVDGYAVRDVRFRVVHKSNGGEGSARNAGLNVAQGEFIAFLDGDDIWHPRLLEIVSCAMVHYRDVERFGFRDILFNDGVQCPWEKLETMPKLAVYDLSGRVTEQFFKGGLLWFVYRRERLAGLRFRPYVVGADLAYRDECVARMPKSVMIDAALYGYRQRQGSAMHVVLTRRKFADSLLWMRDRLRIVARIGKPIDRMLCRHFCLRLTEWVAWDYFRLAKLDRAESMHVWLSVLEEMYATLPMLCYYKITTGLVLFCRHEFCIRIFFWLPMFLKRKGFHR